MEINVGFMERFTVTLGWLLSSLKLVIRAEYKSHTPPNSIVKLLTSLSNSLINLTSPVTGLTLKFWVPTNPNETSPPSGS
jgi:hypothetical protein